MKHNQNKDINCVLQALKNSSKLVMGIGAVLIILGFMIMGQCFKLASLILDGDNLRPCLGSAGH